MVGLFVSYFLQSAQRPFNECGGTYADRSGVITSPSFPGQYPYNADCHYKIIQPIGYYIKINISFMDIETWPGRYAECQTYTGDYLEVRDGMDGDSPMIGRFCGKSGLSIISTSNSLTLR